MRCQVQIDPRCEMDVGDRSPDRRILIVEHIHAIIDLLRGHKGHPPNSFREPAITV